MQLIEKIYWMITCHFVGDYFLQTDYMARNKAFDLYIMFTHCICYCLPFVLRFGLTWRILCIFLVHIVMDSLKCRKVITLATDQAAHLAATALFLI